MRILIALGTLLLLFACQSPSRSNHPFENLPVQQGKEAYLASPYVTAGDRLYVVGHQDGSFPDLGWHVTGEMGGIWDHPIKLMDGFSLALVQEADSQCIGPAKSFANYPVGNQMEYGEILEGVTLTRSQWIPDGKEAVVLTFSFNNAGAKDQEFTFIFNGLTDLSPVWLGERTHMKDGPDEVSFLDEERILIAKDRQSDWFVAWKSDRMDSGYRLDDSFCASKRKGSGANASMSYDLKLAPKQTQTLNLVIAGSYQSEAAALETLREVLSKRESLLKEKIARYRKIKQTADLQVPDSQIQTAYEWVKYNTDWLIREVPEQGRGLGAGIPDYPWWFGCDNEYTLQGVLATGRQDIVFETIELLRKLSEAHNGNGRIVHEVSTNGAVFNPGNINETPQFATLIWSTFKWTGDRAFLAEYYPFVKKGMQWLMEEGDVDGNLFPDGAGMMEVRGLESEMIDVATYTQKAFSDVAAMARVLDNRYDAIQFQALADSLAAKINREFWVEEFNSYADFIGSTEEALHLIEDAIVRADTLDKPWAVAELEQTKSRIMTLPPEHKQGFVLHHNWVVNTPLETGIAPKNQAMAALETGSKFVNPFGVFVTGIDRDESAGKDQGSFAEGKKVFSYTGAVMTLPTGVQAIAENNYGRPDSALNYLRRLVNSFSYALPGSMYEVSPDFGMVVQAWNTYALAVPLIQQFLGVNPMAHEQRIILSPQLPKAWPEARLKGLPVGDNTLNLHIVRTDEGVRMEAEQSQKNWKINLRFPLGQYSSWKINGKAISPEINEGFEEVEWQGSKLVLELE